MKALRVLSVGVLLGLAVGSSPAQTNRSPGAGGATGAANLEDIVNQLARSGAGRDVPTSPGNKEPQDLDRKARALLAEGKTLLYRRNQPDLGIARIEEALKIDPRMPSAYTAVFAYYSVLRADNARAATLLEGGLQPCPKSSGVRFHLGNVYAALQRHQEAIDQFGAALMLEPEYPASIHYNIGNSYERMGRLPLAMASWNRALGADEKHLNARRNLVVANYKGGSLEEARKQAKRLIELDPNGRIGSWAQEAMRLM